jgi:hypothetical protein
MFPYVSETPRGRLVNHARPRKRLLNGPGGSDEYALVILYISTV